MFLNVADSLGFNVFATSPLLSGLMMQVPISSRFAKANYLAPKHLNFIRSLPFDCVKSVIFGALNNRHLKLNLSLPYTERMQEKDVEEMIFTSSSRKQQPEQPEKDLLF